MISRLPSPGNGHRHGHGHGHTATGGHRRTLTAVLLISSGIAIAEVTGAIITGSLVSIALLVTGFLFLQRYWQNGLSFGSLKG